MAIINYEVRLKNSSSYDKEDIEASLRNIFELFDEYPTYLIPKAEKARIMRYINEIMDETDTKNLERDFKIIEECVAEIIVFEENENRVGLPGAKLGSFHLYHVDKADGEEEHIDEEGTVIPSLKMSHKINFRSRDRSLPDVDVAKQVILRTLGVSALQVFIKKRSGEICGNLISAFTKISQQHAYKLE